MNLRAEHVGPNAARTPVRIAAPSAKWLSGILRCSARPSSRRDPDRCKGRNIVHRKRATELNNDSRYDRFGSPKRH
jgi:hypothetical protein